MVSLGNISSLGSEIGEKHDFDNCPEGMTNYYGRDRGETEVDTKIFTTPEEFVEYYSNEYHYLHDGKQWLVAVYDDDFVPLKDALAK